MRLALRLGVAGWVILEFLNSADVSFFMLLVKVLLIALLVMIVISLFTGLGFLLKDKGQTNRTAYALSVRIGLSVLAIIVVIVAAATGVLQVNPSPL